MTGRAGPVPLPDAPDTDGTTLSDVRLVTGERYRCAQAHKAVMRLLRTPNALIHLTTIATFEGVPGKPGFGRWRRHGPKTITVPGRSIVILRTFDIGASDADSPE